MTVLQDHKVTTFVGGHIAHSSQTWLEASRPTVSGRHLGARHSVKMITTYDPLQLVHAHLPPPLPIPFAIPTLRVPSERAYPSTAAELAEPLHPDHAVSTAYHAATGILARAISNGYVLELRTLSTVVNKDLSADGPGSEVVRIHFPDRLAPLVDSCIVPIRRDDKVYILVVTQGRMVYRLAFPYGSFHPASGDRFVFTTTGGDDWSEEYEIPEEVLGKQGDIGAWMVIDQDTVVLDGSEGGMTKLSRFGTANSGEPCEQHVQTTC